MSDLHFTNEGDVVGHDPRTRLRMAVQHINTLHSDAEMCLISGDMVEQGTLEEYRALRAELDALSMPYMPMMGNHDHRRDFRERLSLPNGCMDDFVQYSIETPEGLIVCLDTHQPGSSAGEFCASRADWFRAIIAGAEATPVFLFMHHPPMDLGLPMQDTVKMADGDAFLDLITEYSSVKYVFFGHIHRPISGTVRGIPFSSMRSVLYQAPAPRPEWDWQSFQAAQEAPNIGVLSIQNGDITLQYEQFCEYATGVNGSST